jgi:hypothetical protein
MTQALPKELPRFAESWRVHIYDEFDRRMFTTEWKDSVWFNRAAEDLPKLLKVGPLWVTASTASPEAHSYEGARAWYGDQNYPVCYWHWKHTTTGWEWPSDKLALEWMERRKIRGGLQLFKLGRNEDFCP